MSRVRWLSSDGADSHLHTLRTAGRPRLEEYVEVRWGQVCLGGVRTITHVCVRPPSLSFSGPAHARAGRRSPCIKAGSPGRSDRTGHAGIRRHGTQHAPPSPHRSSDSRHSHLRRTRLQQAHGRVRGFPPLLVYCGASPPAPAPPSAAAGPPSSFGPRPSRPMAAPWHNPVRWARLWVCMSGRCGRDAQFFHHRRAPHGRTKHGLEISTGDVDGTTEYGGLDWGSVCLQAITADTGSIFTHVP